MWKVPYLPALFSWTYSALVTVKRNGVDTFLHLGTKKRATGAPLHQCSELRVRKTNLIVQLIQMEYNYVASLPTTTVDFSSGVPEKWTLQRTSDKSCLHVVDMERLRWQNAARKPNENEFIIHFLFAFFIQNSLPPHPAKFETTENGKTPPRTWGTPVRGGRVNQKNVRSRRQNTKGKHENG